MKIKFLRGLIIARRWANTENGEKIIVTSLTSMAFVAFICASLFLVGSYS